MEKVYLMNYTFGEGSGIRVYASGLFNQLLKENINVEKIDISKAILPRYNRDLVIKHYLYFLLRKNDLKGKNLHILAPGILPVKYLYLPKKKIVTVHDFYIFYDWLINESLKKLNPVKRIIRKHIIMQDRETYRYIKKYDYVFTRNEVVKDKLIKEFEVDKDKVEISYGLILDKFQPMKKEKSDDKVIIGFINNFSGNKTEKLKSFIEIFKQVKDKDLEFHIYGKNFPFSELIKDDARIKYFGFLPEDRIVETYNQFDVYLSTSKIEGFGLPIMQAKACKVPVLCYNGDIPDISKRNTLLWNDENLVEILQNRLWEKVNVDKAYLDAEECRPNKVIPKIISVYNKVFE